MLLLAGCTQQNVKEVQVLDPSEGILVTTAQCNPFIYWMQFYTSGKRATGFNRDGVIACGTGVGRQSLLRTIRVKEGKYFVGMVGAESSMAISEEDAISFTVERGKLNYIGDLEIPLTGLERNVRYIDIRVSDREAATRETVETQYPSLLKTYPWVKRISVDPRH